MRFAPSLIASLNFAPTVSGWNVLQSWRSGRLSHIPSINAPNIQSEGNPFINPKNSIICEENNICVKICFCKFIFNFSDLPFPLAYFLSSHFVQLDWWDCIQLGILVPCTHGYRTSVYSQKMLLYHDDAHATPNYN